MPRLTLRYIPKDVALPRQVWMLMIGQTLSSFGNGVILPFNAIYLHLVRGIPIAIVGVVIAAVAGGALVMTMVGGPLVDILGSQTMVFVGLGLQACGMLMFADAINPVIAVTAALVVGAGNGIFYPASTTLLAGLTAPSERSAAASIQYAGINLGIGLGAVSAGAVVAIGRPSTFVAMYLLDAATFLGYGALLWLGGMRPRRPRQHGGRSSTSGAPQESTASYRQVWLNRPFIAVLVFNTLTVMLGYSQLDAAVPLYAKAFLGVPNSAIGLLFAANTAAIVFLQIPVTRRLRGHRRHRVLTLLAGLWAVAWLFGAAASYSFGLQAAVLLGFCFVTFALGECALAGTLAPLAMDLAPPSSRGRHMAALSMTWSVGGLVGPALAGLLLASSFHQAFWPLLTVGSVLLGVLASAMGAVLPAAADLPGSQPPGARQTA